MKLLSIRVSELQKKLRKHFRNPKSSIRDDNVYFPRKIKTKTI